MAGERASFYATLAPSRSGAAPDGIRPELLALVATGRALVAVIAWVAFRRPSEAPSHVFAPTPRAVGEVAALKRPLASYLEDPEFIERFLREAEIGRALNHPSIVRILERGEVERVPYFTMELLEGSTLQAVVGRGPAGFNPSLPDSVGERTAKEWRLKLSVILRITDTDKLRRKAKTVSVGGP